MAQLTPKIRMIDCVLTDLGKKYLAEGNPRFNITQFAVGDDEVDYNLFDTDQPNPEDYGKFIRAMPLFEAASLSTVGLKYKLLTLPSGTTKIPILVVSPDSIDIYEGQEVVITPNILNYTLRDSELSFTAVLRNSALGRLVVQEGVAAAGGQVAQFTTNISQTGGSVVFVGSPETTSVVVGKSFKFIAAQDVSAISPNARSTTIEIFGNIVGSSVIIPVTVTHVSRTTS